MTKETKYRILKTLKSDLKYGKELMINSDENDVNLGLELWREIESIEKAIKEIEGIENNNGWIKIESEDDLPKIGEYDMSTYELLYFSNERVIPARYYKNIWCKITHYQLRLIDKPQPPLY